MRVIAKKRLSEYGRQYPKARIALERWHQITIGATWRSIVDVRDSFGHADAMTVASGKTVTVFNVCGNIFRLITAIHYDTHIVYVLRFLTHSDYEDNRWKDQL